MRHMNASLVRTCDHQNLVRFASSRTVPVAVPWSVPRFVRIRKPHLHFATIVAPVPRERAVTE